jgi:hypothetical protein
VQCVLEIGIDVKKTGRNILEYGNNINGTKSSECRKAHMSFGNVEILRKPFSLYTLFGIREGTGGYI